MKRIVKQTVAGVMLFISVLSLFLVQRSEQTLPSFYFLPLTILSGSMVIISAIAFVSYLRIGWRISGPGDEWTVTTVTDPSMPLHEHLTRHDPEEAEEKDGLEIDDDYFRRFQ